MERWKFSQGIRRMCSSFTCCSFWICIYPTSRFDFRLSGIFWKYSVMIVELLSHFHPREGTHTQYILVVSSLEKSDYVIFASIFAVCHTHYLYLQPSFTDLVPSLVQFPLLDQNKNLALCDLVFFFFFFQGFVSFRSDEE